LGWQNILKTGAAVICSAFLLALRALVSMGLYQNAEIAAHDTVPTFYVEIALESTKKREKF